MKRVFVLLSYISNTRTKFILFTFFRPECVVVKPLKIFFVKNVSINCEAMVDSKTRFLWKKLLLPFFAIHMST